MQQGEDKLMFSGIGYQTDIWGKKQWGEEMVYSKGLNGNRGEDFVQKLEGYRILVNI
jgi:hypothetical protein